MFGPCRYGKLQPPAPLYAHGGSSLRVITGFDEVEAQAIGSWTEPRRAVDSPRLNVLSLGPATMQVARCIPPGWQSAGSVMLCLAFSSHAHGHVLRDRIFLSQFA